MKEKLNSPGSEIKDLANHSTKISIRFMFALVYFCCNVRDSGRFCACSETVSQMKNLQFMWPGSFMLGWKQFYQTFALEGDIIFIMLDSKQVCCLSHGEILSFFNVFRGTDMFKKIVWNKDSHHILYCREWPHQTS